jgi:cation diffusion facilitator CzcD-associated flavoprotein CzcO
VKDYGVEDDLSLNHEVLRASWSDATAQWEVMVKDLKSSHTKLDTADFLVSAQGRLNKWTYPDIPGLQTRFNRPLFHTGDYDPSFELKGKRVAIIGNGASGQQLLPNILPDVAHIGHYIRSKTWVTPTFSGDLHRATAEKPGGPRYTAEQKREWKDNPASFLNYRRDLEVQFHGRWPGSILGSPENEAFRQSCIKIMRERVGGDESWLAKLLPDYTPGCKRPTPAPGYIEALLTPKVEFITDPILEATQTGLVTADGKHREVDVIIAATGHKDGFLPRFPTIGQRGVDLGQLWAKDGPIGFPETYFGIMAPGFPNYFFIMSAQGMGGGSSFPMQCEISATYIAKAIRKVQSQSYRALQPSVAATAEFNQIVEGYFDDKVMSDSCNAWSKLGKGRTRVLLQWPGSGHHRFDISRDPRWEDFDFIRNSNALTNRYEYFGNGWTERERRNRKEEVAGYLHEIGKYDLATLHEAWNS